MGRPKRPQQPTDNARLSVEDNILGGLAQEICNLGQIAEFEPGLYEDGNQKAPGRVRIYTHGIVGKVCRMYVFCINGKLVTNDACGERKLAGKLEWELADPETIDKVLHHINRRIWHWSQVERCFGKGEGNVEGKV